MTQATSSTEGICKGCGEPIEATPDERARRHCDGCGASLDEASAAASATGGEDASMDPTRLIEGVDGEHRWLYEMRLWRDSLLPATLFKVSLLAGLAPFLLLTFLALVEGTLARDFTEFVKVYLLVTGILLVLVFASYYLVFVPLNGGRYPLVFEMDEAGINRLEMPKKSNKMGLIQSLGVLGGIATGNLAVAGASLMAASRNQMYTRFRDVRKVVVYRRKRAIKLLAKDMTRNLVYCHELDLERLVQMIVDRSPKDVRVRNK